MSSNSTKAWKLWSWGWRIEQQLLVGQIIKITPDEIDPYHTSIRYGINEDETAKIEAICSDVPLKMLVMDYDEYMQDFKVFVKGNVGYIADVEMRWAFIRCNMYYLCS